MYSLPLFPAVFVFLLDIIREIDLDPKLVSQFVDTGTVRADDTSNELSIDVKVG